MLIIKLFLILFLTCRAFSSEPIVNNIFQVQADFSLEKSNVGIAFFVDLKEFNLNDKSYVLSIAHLFKNYKTKEFQLNAKITSKDINNFKLIAISKDLDLSLFTVDKYCLNPIEIKNTVIELDKNTRIYITPFLDNKIQKYEGKFDKIDHDGSLIIKVKYALGFSGSPLFILRDDLFIGICNEGFTKERDSNGEVIRAKDDKGSAVPLRIIINFINSVKNKNPSVIIP